MTISLVQFAEIAEWPLYVTDEGAVSCNKVGCEESRFLWRAPARRIALAEFLWTLHAHATSDHK